MILTRKYSFVNIYKDLNKELVKWDNSKRNNNWYFNCGIKVDCKSKKHRFKYFWRIWQQNTNYPRIENSKKTIHNNDESSSS